MELTVGSHDQDYRPWAPRAFLFWGAPGGGAFSQGASRPGNGSNAPEATQSCPLLIWGAGILLGLEVALARWCQPMSALSLHGP